MFNKPFHRIGLVYDIYERAAFGSNSGMQNRGAVNKTIETQGHPTETQGSSAIDFFIQYMVLLKTITYTGGIDYGRSKSKIPM